MAQNSNVCLHKNIGVHHTSFSGMHMLLINDNEAGMLSGQNELCSERSAPIYTSSAMRRPNATRTNPTLCGGACLYHGVLLLV